MSTDEAKVARVQELIDAARERSPIGAEYERNHPDRPAVLLISVRDLSDALSDPQEFETRTC